MALFANFASFGFLYAALMVAFFAGFNGGIAATLFLGLLLFSAGEVDGGDEGHGAEAQGKRLNEFHFGWIVIGAVSFSRPAKSNYFPSLRGIGFLGI